MDPVSFIRKNQRQHGTTGNDNIPDYQFYELFTTNQYSYQNVVGLNPIGFNNPDLAWEETKKLEASLSLGFAKDRVLTSISYYRNLSSNQLLNAELSAVTGFTGFPTNFPAIVENSGWEWTVDATIIQTKKISWRASFNISAPKNRLKSFPDLENNFLKYQFVVDQSLECKKIVSIRRCRSYFRSLYFSK